MLHTWEILDKIWSENVKVNEILEEEEDNIKMDIKGISLVDIG